MISLTNLDLTCCLSALCSLLFVSVIFFFFKQKTAYEIGLGIPAEPLFRSTLFPYTQDAFSRSGWLWPVDAKGEPLRSEERRVGKECRSGLVSNDVTICSWARFSCGHDNRA